MSSTVPAVSEDQKDFADILHTCLKIGDAKSWEEFIRLAQPVVASAVVRSLKRWDRNPCDLADDLVQETFVKLFANNCRVLRVFSAGNTNALCAYMRTIATSVVADHLNSQSAQKRGGGVQLLTLDGPETSSVSADDAPLREIERNLVLQRVEECLSKQRERDRTIFWLYHRHGFSPQAISAYPGIQIGKSGVETILYRLTNFVRDCVNRRPFRPPTEGVNL